MKDNWVNGECINKIKFPCLCEFTPAKDVRIIGMINRGMINGSYRYILTDISQQYYDSNLESHLYQNLEQLIKDFDIHIRKGKIIIYEDFGGYTVIQPLVASVLKELEQKYFPNPILMKKVIQIEIEGKNINSLDSFVVGMGEYIKDRTDRDIKVNIKEAGND